MVRSLNKYLAYVKARGFSPLTSACAFKWVTRKRLPSRIVSYPQFAQIEISNACNLRCTMCGHSSDVWRRSLERRNMTLDEFKLIIARLPGILHVELNGVGEPLLNPGLLEMIAHAHGTALTTAFFTNATLLTPGLSERLVCSPGLIEIKVSIDTADPADYAEVRVGANLAQVLGNLESLVTARRRTGRDLPLITVSMTALRKYVQDIPKLVQAIRKIGFTSLQVKDVLSTDYAPNERLAPEEVAAIDGFQRFFVKQGFHIIHVRSTPVNRAETRTCIAPWHTIYIEVSGDVHPCCFTPFSDMVFGNIFKSDFWKVWNNDLYQAFRRELRTGMPKKCLFCPAHGQRWIPPCSE